MKFLKLVLVFLILVTISAHAAEVSIVVTVPATTPEHEKICITGNLPELSSWSGSGIRLKEIGPNLFSFSENFATGTRLEFKFTRGSFATVEKTSKGYEIPNRQLVVPSQGVSVKLEVEAWADQLGDNAYQPNITGNYQLMPQIKSKFLKAARDVIVWLPPSYSRNKKLRYPVLYMHDGGNLFDPGTSFGGVDWGVDEAMSDGISKGLLREAIVVAVGNTSERMSEYTPFPDPKHKGGDGENYAKFLLKELKPMIDKKFRTKTGRTDTFIGGSSLGGLISLYIGISRKDKFGGIIAMSPSIWWANGGIIDWLLQNQVGEFKGKIWVDMGTREGEEAIANTRKLAATMAEQVPEFKGFVYKEFVGGTHSEGSWRKRMPLVLRQFIGNR